MIFKWWSRLTSPQSQLSRLDVLHSHALPVEEIAESLGAVSLVDALTLALAGEIEHVLGQLVDAVVNTLESAVDDVNAVVGGVLDQLLHVASKSGQVGRDGWHAHYGTLGWSVAPRLIVGAENAHVRSTYEVVVVYREHRVGGVEEFGVEDNLDTVGGLVEELTTANLVKDGVFAVVDHVVSDDWREVVTLHGEETTAEHNLVLLRQKVLVVRWRLTLPPRKRLFEKLLADITLDVSNSVVQALDHRLSLERLDG